MNNSNKRASIIIVLALIVIAGSFICGYQTCSNKKDDADQSMEKQAPENNSGLQTPVTRKKNEPAPQPMNLEQKIQRKITEKVEKEENPKETKQKKQLNNDDGPAGNVSAW